MNSFKKICSHAAAPTLLTMLALAVSIDPGVRSAQASAQGPATDGSSRMHMRTIGVVGGIGPQATMDFEARVHRVAQQRLKPHLNNSYPPMVVYYHRRPPFVTGEDSMPTLPMTIDPQLREALARMGPQVDFLVITSNGAHKLADQMERAAGRPVLSMVDRVVEEVRRRNWKKVGVLTLGRPTVYTQHLDRLGIGHVALGEAQQKQLDQVIFGVMEGREDESAQRVAHEALAAVRNAGVDGVILGCTELPFLIRPSGAEADLINPIQLLAEAAVELATQ